MCNIKKSQVIFLLILVVIISFIIYKARTIILIHSLEDPVAVRVTKVEKQIWQQKITLAGVTKAAQEVDLTSSESGVIKQIFLHSGAAVQENDVLLVLDDAKEKAALEQAQAKYALAKASYERHLKLSAKNIISPAELDKLSYQVKRFAAEVNLQKAIVEGKIIKAPFAGLLGISNVNLGQYITPATKIIALKTRSPVLIDFAVSEKFMEDVKINQIMATTTLAYPDIIFQAKVIAIANYINSDTCSMQIQAEINNENHRLVPGMLVTMQLPVGEKHNAIEIPQSAIVYSPKGSFVYVVKNNAAWKRQIKIGEIKAECAEIFEGLNNGDSVVTAGQLNLYDTCPIKVIT